MPIYEYQCNSCMHEYEVLSIIKDPDAERCPKCLSPEIAKLISMPADRVYTQFMTPAETRLHLRHKADIEKADKAGKLLDLNGTCKLGSEFEPQLQKRIH